MAAASTPAQPPVLRFRVLVVDDDPALRFGVRDFLEAKGYLVSEAGGCVAAELAFRSARPDVVVADHDLGDGTALDLLPRLKRIDAAVPVLVLTGHASIDLAVQAVRAGAEHFLTKPVALPALAVVLERAVEERRLRGRQVAAEASGRAARAARGARAADPFLGTSDALRRLEEQARRLAASDRPVCIQGETGAGKGVLARWLHAHGPRADEAFVDLNCAALPRELLESELFGHEKGAFTGAVQAKVGLLEAAHRGTVFLDEVGDMDLALQPKLLKAVEEQRIRRLGEVQDRQVDVRVISASHHDLRALIDAGRFRGDLYYRLSTLPLVIPPLRERPEDVGPIARWLLEELTGEMGGRSAGAQAPPELTPGAVAALAAYAWPGNVRELRNALERAVLLGDGGPLAAAHFALGPAPLGTAAPAAARPLGPAEAGAGAADGGPADDAPADELALTLEDVERRHVARVLRAEGGRVERAAVRLGVPRSTLYQKIRQFGLGRGRA